MILTDSGDLDKRRTGTNCGGSGNGKGRGGCTGYATPGPAGGPGWGRRGPAVRLILSAYPAQSNRFAAALGPGMNYRNGVPPRLVCAETAMTPGPPDHPPQLGRYDVVGLIAEGGMGVVYKGRNRATGELVAIKVVAAG